MMSRGLVHRIEKGEMGSTIGAAFEVTAIVGMRLTPAFSHLTISRITRRSPRRAARKRRSLGIY